MFLDVKGVGGANFTGIFGLGLAGCGLASGVAGVVVIRSASRRHSFYQAARTSRVGCGLPPAIASWAVSLDKIWRSTSRISTYNEWVLPGLIASASQGRLMVTGSRAGRGKVRSVTVEPGASIQVVSSSRAHSTASGPKLVGGPGSGLLPLGGRWRRAGAGHRLPPLRG